MLQVPLPPKMLCILHRIAVVTGANVCDSWLSNSVLVGDVAKRNVVTYSVYESGDVYHRDVVTSVYIHTYKKKTHIYGIPHLLFLALCHRRDCSIHGQRVYTHIRWRKNMAEQHGFRSICGIRVGGHGSHQQVPTSNSSRFANRVPCWYW